MTAARSFVGRVIAHPLVHTTVLTAVAIVAGLWLGPDSYYGFLTTIAFLYGTAAIGLNIPAGMLGQLSLGQGAAMALGAYSAAILIVDHDWALLPALVVCLVIGLLVGTLMAIPAARLGLIGLAIVTVGFTLVVSDALIGMPDLTGGANGMFGVYAPLISGEDLSERALFIVVVVTCALAYLVHWRLRVSTFGRACLAVRDDELGATALGISGYLHVVVGFAIGSGIGAVAGGLYANVTTVVTPELFGVHVSVLILLMVIFGGPGTRFGPIIGATVIGLLPILLSENPDVSVYLFGAILIVSMRVLPKGVFRRTAAPVSPAELGSALGGPAQPTNAVAVLGDPATNGDAPHQSREAGVFEQGELVLEVEGVSRSFGGVKAVKEANLQIHRGELVAIIGSNGSGKTTLLNVICGYYPAQSGSVRLLGEDITHHRPRAIARQGVSRTFQVPKVFPSLSVEENLALARAKSNRSSAHFDAVADEFLASTSVLAHPTREARTLSHGSLRFLEVAMAVVRGPDLLLLDEPAAGLSGSEMERLGEVVQKLRRHGVAVALIEHHLDWVRSLADHVSVMHLGDEIWSGDPDSLMTADAVRDAYLLGASGG